MHRTAIVGCGRIGGLLDLPGDPWMTTHAHAYIEHPETELVACCDPDPKQLARFTARWGSELRTYDDLTAMLDGERLDMVSVCAPSAAHAEILQALLDAPRSKVIVCEKPLVETREQYEAVTRLLNDRDKRLVINYMRRFDPALEEAERRLKRGELGGPIAFTATFTKGLYHNGSHMLELIDRLVGPVASVSGVAHWVQDGDAYGVFHVEAGACSGTLRSFPDSSYFLFELDLTCERGRLRIEDSGHRIRIEKPAPWAQYAGYMRLVSDEVLPDTLTKNALHTIDFAVKAMNGQAAGYQDILHAHLQLTSKLLDVKTTLIGSTGSRLG